MNSNYFLKALALVSLQKLLYKVLNSIPWSLTILVTLFVLLNSFLFYKHGIKVVDDSPRYLGYAARMMEKGFFYDPHEFWYIAYPLFMILSRTVHDSLEMVIIAQYFLSFLALISIYFASHKLFENPLAAFLTALLFLLFFEISIYNSYILCESFFVSMTCISLFFLSKWYKNGTSIGNLILGYLALLLTVLAKPTGIAILVAVTAYLLFRIFKEIKMPLLKVSLGIVLAVPLFLLVDRMLTTFSFMNEYIRGDIIFGMFQYKDSPHYGLLTINRPDSLYIPDVSFSPLVRLTLFIFYNPLYWGKLFLAKILYFFLHVRPFWSIWHNIFSLIFLLPVYYFFSKAMISKKMTSEVILFIVVYIFLHGLIVGLMTEDWDGRFLIPVLPVILIPAGLGISHVFAGNDKMPKLHFVTDKLENSFSPKF